MDRNAGLWWPVCLLVIFSWIGCYVHAKGFDQFGDRTDDDKCE